MAVFGIVLILLGAFFGSTQAGVICYTRDHAQVERAHRQDPEYPALLGSYETIGAAIGSVPGVMLFLFARRRKARAAL